MAARVVVRSLSVVVAAALSLSAATVPAMAGPDGWSDPVRVGGGEQRPLLSHELHTSADGTRALAVWKDVPSLILNGFLGAEIAAATSGDGGKSWSSASSFIPGDASTTGEPAAAMSSDGSRMVVVWDEDSGGGTKLAGRYSSDGGATWNIATMPADTLEFPGSNSVDVGMSDDGMRAVVLFSTTAGLFSSTSPDGGETWSTKREITDAQVMDGSLAVSDTAQYVRAVWRSAESPFPVATAGSGNGGASWSGPSQLSPGSGDIGAFAPAFTASADGSVATVAWIAYDGAANPMQEWVRVRTTTDSGSSWSPTRDVATFARGHYGFALDIDSDSSGTYATATWSRYSEPAVDPVAADEEEPTGYTTDTVSTGNAGQSWSDPQTLDTGSTTDTVPDVDVSDSGRRQALTWSHGTGVAPDVSCGGGSGSSCLQPLSSAVRVARTTDAGGVWSSPTELTAPDSFGGMARVAGSGSQDRLVVNWLSGVVFLTGGPQGDVGAAVPDLAAGEPGVMSSYWPVVAPPAPPGPDPVAPPTPTPTPTQTPTTSPTPPAQPPAAPGWATYRLLDGERTGGSSVTAQGVRFKKRTLVRWGKSSGATGYAVAVDGKTTCRTGAQTRECTVPAVGRRAEVQVQAVGPGGTSTAIAARYVKKSTVLVRTVRFGPDSAQLVGKQKRKVRQYAAKLAQRGFTQVVLDGYTAQAYQPGSPSFRKRLSQRRARAVEKVMRAKWRSMGVTVRVKVRAFGAADPVADNDTGKGRAKNRRATINIR